MKVAIPSNDTVTISPHFGRTAGFLVFDIQKNQIVHEEFRPNKSTHHATARQHQHGPHLGTGHQEPHGHHGPHHQGHERILGALGDCEVVIAGGMGSRLQEDLKQAGKQIFITSQRDARKAVDLLLHDNLESDQEACDHK